MNVNHPSRYSALAASAILGHYSGGGRRGHSRHGDRHSGGEQQGRLWWDGGRDEAVLGPPMQQAPTTTAPIPVGARRPLTDETFFDSWMFELGEYASKVAYHWGGPGRRGGEVEGEWDRRREGERHGQIRWGHVDEDAWDAVQLYRKVLAEAEDASVTIVSIGFFENVSVHPGPW